MDNCNLVSYNRQYEQIMQLDIPVDDRNVRLAELMTSMEKEFRINVFSFKEWEKLPGNQEIAELYSKISKSRKF